MISPVSIALSGLLAAKLRLDIAASNVANSQDVGALPGTRGQVPYAPMQVMQTDTGSGTFACPVPVTPAYIKTFDSQSPDTNAQGLVAVPNVDLTQELLQMEVARQSYEASLKSLETAFSTTNRLLGTA
jgi:flagellar basal-body rod protein FlgC